MCREDERKRTADDVSENGSDVVETRDGWDLWDQAWRVPVYWPGDNRYKGGVILITGSCVERGNLRRDAKGESEGGSTAEGRVPMHDVGTDRFGVAMKPSNLGGAKGSDRPAKDCGQPETG